MDLTWLKDIIDVLPDNSNYQKSFFDISGFPKWENVNSNLLAFYFDKEEEHDLKTLFIESLLMLLKKDTDINFDDNFEVFREYRTNKGNFIDIVIKSNPEENEEDLVSEFSDESETDNQGADWAIIIENKIDAHLYNDLKDYWASVDATHKIGVVLSKNESDLSSYNKKGVYYHTISHKNLIDQVLKNLYNYFNKANEKHLILLKEYFNNIENIYSETIMDEKYSIILDQLHEHKEDIQALHDTEVKLLKFVSEEVFEIFNEFGFKPNSDKKTSKAKHFYAEKEELDKENIEIKYNGFRFWVSLKRLVYGKEFLAFFELHNKANTKYGTRVKDILSKKNIFTKHVSKGTGGGDNNAHNHIYRVQIPLTITEHSNFPTEFKAQLKLHFFEHPNAFLNEAVNALKQAKLQ